jgi:hypothetical protein
LAIFYLSQWLALPSSSVAANVVDADVSTSEEDVDFGLGG